MSLENKRVVVLGGSSGIGLAVAQASAVEGAQVVVASSNAERVQHAVSTLPTTCTGQVVNLLDETAVRTLFDEVGPFDHLVYTAGEPLALSPIDDTSLNQARRFFELRYWGAFTAAKWGHKHIRSGGSIVFTSGVAGVRPGPGWSVAASICSAMEAFTRGLAVELAPLRVNIVSPGVVKSPLWRNMDTAAREALYASEEQRLLVGHVAEPKEIALGYLYLMSQSYGTGQTLVVDGGGLLT